MQISEKELRQMMQEVDDQHHEGMKSFKEANFSAITDTRSSRRSFIQKAGIGAGALTIGSTVLPFSNLLSPVSAQELTDADIAEFAAGVEYAAVAAYEAAAGSGKVTTPAVGEAAALFASHHQQHGDAFAAFIGKDGQIGPNETLLNALAGQLDAAADEAAVIKLAYDTEEGAASTYLFALGALQDQGAADATSSILPVEAAHAVVLGNVMGMDLATLIPAFETQDGFLNPADFPATAS